MGREVDRDHEITMDGAVGCYDAEFSFHKVWVELTCPKSCKAGVTDLKLLESCGMVPVPGLFSAINLALGVFEGIKNLPRLLCGTGAGGLKVMTEANQ